jgi:hypothetical protein
MEWKKSKVKWTREINEMKMDKGRVTVTKK